MRSRRNREAALLSAANRKFTSTPATQLPHHFLFMPLFMFDFPVAEQAAIITQTVAAHSHNPDDTNRPAETRVDHQNIVKTSQQLHADRTDG